MKREDWEKLREYRKAPFLKRYKEIQEKGRTWNYETLLMTLSKLK